MEKEKRKAVEWRRWKREGWRVLASMARESRALWHPLCRVSWGAATAVVQSVVHK
jgi:hypothetical protein